MKIRPRQSGDDVSPNRAVRIGEIAYQLDQLSVGSAPQLIELGLRLDPLRTLVVKEDADAASVAGVVDQGEITHVVVRGEAGPFVGILVVDWAKEKVSENLGGPVTTLVDAVSTIFQNGARDGSYHHEWLNLNRPPLIYCRGGHWADADPCNQHRE